MMHALESDRLRKIDELWAMENRLRVGTFNAKFYDWISLGYEQWAGAVFSFFRLKLDRAEQTQVMRGYSLSNPAER